MNGLPKLLLVRSRLDRDTVTGGEADPWGSYEVHRWNRGLYNNGSGAYYWPLPDPIQIIVNQSVHGPGSDLEGSG